MTKQELKTGMTVRLRNGDRYLVIRDTCCNSHKDILWSKDGYYVPLCNYDDNMLNIPKENKLNIKESVFKASVAKYDIVAVWAPEEPSDIYKARRCKLLFERTDTTDSQLLETA